MKILFAADMSFNYLAEYPGEEAVKKAMAECAEKFAQADFSIVNLENVFGNKEEYEPIQKSGPNLISSDEYVNYIKVLNPSVVGIANNHTGDYGEGAIFHTFEVLSQNGFPHIGAGANIKEAYKPFIMEKDGLKVGIIAVCENEFGGAKENKAGSAVYNLTRLQREMDALHAQGIKSVVYFHGGNEKNPFPSPGKKELYRHFVDMGASAVVAMHTHCPQGYETYKGSPIIYSMSNFYFPRPKDMKQFYVSEDAKKYIAWNHGYMTELDFSADATGIKVIPYSFDADAIRLLKGEELAHFEEYLAYITSVIHDDEKLEKYFDAWCVDYCRENDTSIIFEESMIEQNVANVPRARNRFTCEAHNEVWKNYYSLCYEKRVEESLYLMDEIRFLQRMELRRNS